MSHKKEQHDMFYWLSHKKGKEVTDDRPSQTFIASSYNIHGTLVTRISIFGTGTGSDIIPHVSFASNLFLTQKNRN